LYLTDWRFEYFGNDYGIKIGLERANKQPDNLMIDRYFSPGSGDLFVEESISLKSSSIGAACSYPTRIPKSIFH